MSRRGMQVKIERHRYSVSGRDALSWRLVRCRDGAHLAYCSSVWRLRKTIEVLDAVLVPA